MPRLTAGDLVVQALEDVGVRYTFGIPGVHNTEIYDALANSDLITPVLVTSEFSGSFLAEAVSRLSGSIGCLVLVPAAGFTHAMSGIGEAYLDGIPLLVITGGVRNDGRYRYQLHEIDQLELARGITKGAFRVATHEEVIPTIHEAYRLATSGVPGPVLVEIPANLQLYAGEVPEPPSFRPPEPPPLPPPVQIDKVADFLNSAKHPLLYVGWGARGAGERLVELAERLQAPVVTTLQGLAVFPHDHPLHAGFTFGPSAVPAARNAAKDHDAVIAIGARFAEIPTGSYSIPTPQNLVHVDLDPAVIDANYPARFALVGDANAVVEALLPRLHQHAPRLDLTDQIAADKSEYVTTFSAGGDTSRVNPARFLTALRAHLDAAGGPPPIVTVDDGNHTYLVAELWTVRRGEDLVVPTDFNAMGYAVPAAVGAKLTNREREVVAIVGDGCFRMTGLELATATALGLGFVVYVFHDGELSQIAQAQQLPYRRKTCTVLPELDHAGLARAVGAEFLTLGATDDLGATIARAHDLAAAGRVVVVDVLVDYSQATAFTQGILKANFLRMPARDKARSASRIVKRALAERAEHRRPTP